jgi:hypothetical protein
MPSAAAATERLVPAKAGIRPATEFPAEMDPRPRRGRRAASGARSEKWKPAFGRNARQNKSLEQVRRLAFRRTCSRGARESEVSPPALRAPGGKVETGFSHNRRVRQGFYGAGRFLLIARRCSLDASRTDSWRILRDAPAEFGAPGDKPDSRPILRDAQLRRAPQDEANMLKQQTLHPEEPSRKRRRLEGHPEEPSPPGPAEGRPEDKLREGVSKDRPRVIFSARRPTRSRPFRRAKLQALRPGSFLPR